MLFESLHWQLLLRMRTGAVVALVSSASIPDLSKQDWSRAAHFCLFRFQLSGERGHCMVLRRGAHRCWSACAPARRWRWSATPACRPCPTPARVSHQVPARAARCSGHIHSSRLCASL